MKIAYVCPTYKEEELHHYTLKALDSFFRTTAGGVAIVVDDCSVGWAEKEAAIKRTPLFDGQEVYVHHFSEWGGLTRSWNKGLEIADGLDVDYAIASNNDIIFSNLWYEGLLHAISHGYSLVGPLSNAPGVTSQGRAEVWRYIRDYTVSDDPAKINAVAERARKEFAGRVIEVRVNGFFQMAAMGAWRTGKYDDNHFYCPYNPKTGSGRNNPTPLMTLNEDEIQRRWSRLKRTFAVCMSSFIFHYRAVTRGRKYTRGKWFRMSGG